jgi:hypothetical protein
MKQRIIDTITEWALEFPDERERKLRVEIMKSVGKAGCPTGRVH